MSRGQLSQSPQIVDVRKAEKIYEVFRYISDNIGKNLYVSSMAEELGLNRRTAKIYLKYLEATYLIEIFENYSKKPSNRTRKVKKAYPTHPSLAIHVSGRSMDDLDDALM